MTRNSLFKVEQNQILFPFNFELLCFEEKYITMRSLPRDFPLQLKKIQVIKDNLDHLESKPIKKALIGDNVRRLHCLSRF